MMHIKPIRGEDFLLGRLPGDTLTLQVRVGETDGIGLTKLLYANFDQEQPDHFLVDPEDEVAGINPLKPVLNAQRRLVAFRHETAEMIIGSFQHTTAMLQCMQDVSKILGTPIILFEQKPVTK